MFLLVFPLSRPNSDNRDRVEVSSLAVDKHLKASQKLLSPGNAKNTGGGATSPAGH